MNRANYDLVNLINCKYNKKKILMEGVIISLISLLIIKIILKQSVKNCGLVFVLSGL
jgi:hypothetical protein